MLTARRHLECSCDRRRDRARSESKPSSDKSPSSGYSSQDSNNEEPSGTAQTGPHHSDTLLIDLSSPGHEDTWGDINILDTDVVGEDKIRDLSFTDIALRKTGVAMLSQLPQDAASRHIDSFVPVELTVPSGAALKGEVSALSLLSLNPPTTMFFPS